jgi:hypothetical protein
MQGWFNYTNQYILVCVIQHINRGKGKNHMILLIDTVKTFDKIQYHFIIKALRKLGIDGMHLNIINII